MALPTTRNEREDSKFRGGDNTGETVIATANEKEVQYSWTNIATQDEFNVKQSAGYLKRIVMNTPLASGVVAVYNNGSGASISMATITNPATLLSDTSIGIDYDLAFDSGLTIVTSGANQDITVVYK